MNFFGINGSELIILAVLAMLLLGPDKIPEYTRKLGEWVKSLRGMAEGAKAQFKEETGTDFDDVDWHKYDPRQYDPRRIVREALSEPLEDVKAIGTPSDSNQDSSAESQSADEAEDAQAQAALTPQQRQQHRLAELEGVEVSDLDAAEQPGQSPEQTPAPFDDEAT